MTPLLPWRPAILSPTDSLRFIATYTFTSLITPGGSSSPRRIFSFFSSKSWRITSTCRSVRSSSSRRSPSSRGSSLWIFRRTICCVRDLLQHVRREHGALLEQPLAAVLVERVGAQRLVVQHLHDALLHLVVKNADLVLQVLLHHLELFGLDRLGPVVLLDALAREDLHADDDPLDARRADERGVADVAGLLAEDRAQQLLFRRQLRLALRRHLADEDVARLHVGADADDAAVVEVAQVGLRHVRDVARDLLGPELRVARLDLELLDVDGGVVVLLHHLLGDEDRVLEVVAAPRHERDEHVAPERELAELRARPVGQHLPLAAPSGRRGRSASG